MNRLAMTISLGLSLSACACGPAGDRTTRSSPSAASTPRNVAAERMKFGRGAAEQAATLSWVRPGTWRPVAMEAIGAMPIPAMMATDPYGSRILRTSGSAGFEVSRVDLHCEKGSYAVIETRRSERDDLAPTKLTKDASVRVPPAEIRRFCSSASGPGVKGTAYEAVVQLRQVGTARTPPPRQSRPEPSADERARAWEAYKARSGIR